MYELLNEQARQAAENILYGTYSIFPTTYFCISNIGYNEVSWFLTKALNEFVDANPYHCVGIYKLNFGLPLITPKFAVYDQKDLVNYSDNIVCTDIVSVQATFNKNYRKKYFWVLNISEIQGFSKELIERINRENYNIVARNKQHKQVLEKIGLKPLPVYFDLLETNALLEYIYGCK